MIADGLPWECGQTTPAIDFDCINVAFKVGKNAVWLTQFLVRWARLGLHGHTDSSRLLRRQQQMIAMATGSRSVGGAGEHRMRAYEQ